MFLFLVVVATCPTCILPSPLPSLFLQFSRRCCPVSPSFFLQAALRYLGAFIGMCLVVPYRYSFYTYARLSSLRPGWVPALAYVRCLVHVQLSLRAFSFSAFCFYFHSPFFLFGSVFLFYFVWAAFFVLLCVHELIGFYFPFLVAILLCTSLYCFSSGVFRSLLSFLHIPFYSLF